MGKERKLLVGKSNTDSNNRAGLDANSLHTASTVSTRSHTHKLIVPPQVKQKPPSTLHVRRIDDASSFRIGKIYVRDFSTSYGDQFQDPATLTIVDYSVDVESTQKAWEESRKALRNDTLQKLGTLAKGKFGDMANMMKAFKKNTGDTLSIIEFAELMRRRNLDVVFPAEDQDLVFEALKSKAASDTPSVGDLLKVVNEADPNYSVSHKSADMEAMREFLADEVAKRRGGEEIQERYEKEQEHTELMKKAVGQKTFGINIAAQDMDALVDDLNEKQHKNESHNKFSRFLRLTNMKLHAAPFYDMRNDPLEKMKEHVKALSDKSLHVNSNLRETRGRERNALDSVDNRYAHSVSVTSLMVNETMRSREASLQALLSDSGNSNSFGPGIMSASKSTPNLSVRSGSGLGSSMQQRQNRPQSDEPATNYDSDPPQQQGESSRPAYVLPALIPPTPIKTQQQQQQQQQQQARAAQGEPPQSHRRLAGRLDEPGGMGGAAAMGIDLSMLSTDQGPPSALSLSPTPSLRQPSFVSPMNQQPDLSIRAPPMTTSLSSPSSHSIASGVASASVASDFIDHSMRAERRDVPSDAHLGKRAVNGRQHTDWYRIGHGGDVLTPRNVRALNGAEGEYRGRYTTTNGDYYPPLIYRPSMPVTRDLTSDADQRYALKADRRHKRYLRLAENVSITKERTERENLEAAARETKRCQKVVDDMINYSTTVFLSDLKSFKKQPLQMMMKKPNLTLSDHMWSGHQGRDKGPESRDFLTTYSGSFDKPTDIKPTLVLEERAAAIGLSWD